MKKAFISKILSCFLIILSLQFITGCDKLPANGLLDGLWQLKEIEDNGVKRPLPGSRMYCSFQLALFQLSTYETQFMFYGYFEHKNNNLHFHSFAYPSKHETSEDNNDWVQESEVPSTIAPWGFYSTDCTFVVEKLTSKNLILKKDGTRIVYEKL